MANTQFCPECGEETGAEMKFCSSCGAEIIVETEAPAGNDTSQGSEQTPPAVPAGQQPPRAPSAAQGAAAGTGADRVKERLRQVQSDPANQEFVEAIKGYATLPGVAAAATAGGVGVLLALAAGVVLAIVVPESSFLSLQGEAPEGPALLNKILVYATGVSLAGLEIKDQVSEGGGEGSFSWQQIPLIFALLPLLGVGYGVVREFPKRLTSETQKSLFLWGLVAGLAFAVAMAVLVLVGAKWEVSEVQLEAGAPLGKTFLYSLIWGCLGGVGGVAYLLTKRGIAIDVPTPGPVGRFLPLAGPSVRAFGVALLLFSLIGTGIWTVQSVRDAADARGDRSMAEAVFDSVLYTGDLGIRNFGLSTNSTLEVGNDSPIYLPGWSAFISPAETPIPIYRGGIGTVEDYGASRDRIDEVIGDQPIEADRAEITIFSFDEVLGPAFIPLVVIFIGLSALLALYAGFLTSRIRAARSTGEAVMTGALVGPIWAISAVILNNFTETVAFGSLLSESAFISMLIGGAVLGGLGALLATTRGPQAPVQ